MPDAPLIPDDVRLVASGLSFPEGPIPLDDGSVVLVEIRRGTLTRVGTDGSVEVVADLGGGPNGAALGPDGKVYVCNNGGFEWHDAGGLAVPGGQPVDYSGGRIERVDLTTGAVERLYDACDGHPLNGPNDLVFDGHGGFYFSDHGKTRARERDLGVIYHAMADGSAITEVVFPVEMPNGVGLSPDGSTLYYAETNTGRVWRRQITGPGVLAPTLPYNPADLVGTVPAPGLLDSLAVDADGGVCVATLVADPGVTRFTADGSARQLVAFGSDYWDPLTTNIAFGGPDLRTAYVTLSGTGRLIACTWPSPGLPLHHQHRRA